MDAREGSKKLRGVRGGFTRKGTPFPEAKACVDFKTGPVLAGSKAASTKTKLGIFWAG